MSSPFAARFDLVQPSWRTVWFDAFGLDKIKHFFLAAACIRTYNEEGQDRAIQGPAYIPDER